MAYINTAAHNEFAPLRRVSELLEGFKANRALRRKYVELYNELDALSDRDLNDIGISRYNISDIARRHVYGA